MSETKHAPTVTQVRKQIRALLVSNRSEEVDWRGVSPLEMARICQLDWKPKRSIGKARATLAAVNTTKRPVTAKVQP